MDLIAEIIGGVLGFVFHEIWDSMKTKKEKDA